MRTINASSMNMSHSPSSGAVGVPVGAYRGECADGRDRGKLQIRRGDRRRARTRPAWPPDCEMAWTVATLRPQAGPRRCMTTGAAFPAGKEEVADARPCRDAVGFRSDIDLRSDGAQIGDRSVAAHGIHSLQLDRSGLQLVTLTDRHRSGRSRAYLGVAMILSASIRPSMRQSKRSFLCGSRSPDRSIGLLGTGAAEGGEEGAGPAGDVVVVDSFA
jgi:hypothetical protein